MGVGTQVLLVDDNPIIRQLLMNSLLPLGTIHSCGNGAEALGFIEKQVPDLIVSDFRMPGVNGLELLGKMRALFPQVAVMMLASRSDISGPLANASSMVEEFIEKPFFVEEATNRIKRVLDRISLGKATREATNTTSVRGTLSQMSVVDLLQTLDIGRKTCRLKLSSGGNQGELHFHDGQLVHATMGTRTGESVVYEVVSWTDGLFVIDFDRVECPCTITHSTQSILMEALRRFDEAQRDAEAPERVKPGCEQASGASDRSMPA